MKTRFNLTLAIATDYEAENPNFGLSFGNSYFKPRRGETQATLPLLRIFLCVVAFGLN